MDWSNCVHCHKCRDNCAFLSKYGIDIGDAERLRELAFHCFLCGRCTAVCPVGIDGREIVLGYRRDKVSSSEKASVEKVYKGLISEKRDYKYRNWKHASSGAVFFPGCNFPSLYPKTNAKLTNLFADNGIGTVYECCGKPIGELGLSDDEERIIRRIRDRLSDSGVTEVVTACPNCRDFFGDRLGIKVNSVYSKLAELGLGSKLNENIELFLPCPDRYERVWVEEIRPFVNGIISCTDAAQCCGLGGSAQRLEPEIADGFVKDLNDVSGTHMYTYCASCMGRFRRCGMTAINHILPRILGTDEQPDTRKSYINRVLTKFK